MIETSKKLNKQLNAKMIEAAKASVAGEKDGRISIKDAQKIVGSTNPINQVGKDTLEHIIQEYNWTPKALTFIKAFLNRPATVTSNSFLPEESPYLGRTTERMEVLMYKNVIYIFHKSHSDSVIWLTRWNPLKDPKGETIAEDGLIGAEVRTDKGLSGAFINDNTVMLANKSDGENGFWTFKINLDANPRWADDNNNITAISDFFNTDSTPATTAFGNNIYFAFRNPDDKYISIGRYNINKDKYEKVIKFSHTTAENAPSIVHLNMNANINNTNSDLIEREQEPFIMALLADTDKHLNFGGYNLAKYENNSLEGFAPNEKDVVIDTPLATNVISQELVQFIYCLKDQKGYGMIDFHIKTSDVLGYFGEHTIFTDNNVNSQLAPTVLQIGNQSYLFYADSDDEDKIKYYRIK